MTGALRICLGLPDAPCRERTRSPSGRCFTCHKAWERARNRGRPYRTNQWTEKSRRARLATPYCAICGRRDDLTLDHEHGQVECRSCNSSHRRNA